MSLIDKYLGEAEKEARYNKQLRQLYYFDSRNTAKTVNADNVKMAKAIIKNSGTKQKLVVEKKEHYTAISKSDASIITVLADNEKDAKEKIKKELNKNPSRRSILSTWEKQGSKVRKGM